MNLCLPRFQTMLLMALLTILSACGGGESTPTPTPATPVTPTLMSIAVTPADTSITVDENLQMVATGLFSDGKSSALTTGVTWSSSGPGVNIVATNGLATGKIGGVETLTATVGTVSGRTKLTVRAPWVTIAAGGSHTVALKKDGTMWVWGGNRLGQLGDGSTLDKLSPIIAGSVTNWAKDKVSAGEFHTVAIRTDGSLWAWGFNQNGQLGDGTTIDRATPVRIGTATNWAMVSAGKAHTVAVKSDGTLWAWGRNSSGQLGDSSTANAGKLVPTQVGTLKTWLSASAGDSHTVALQTSFEIFSWGGNANGQLGQGNATSSATPTKIGTEKWASIVAGGRHTLAIRDNGTLYAWGAGESGQLGLGAQADVLAPQQVVAPAPGDTGAPLSNNWEKIVAGRGHSMAIKTDGTLWTWGANAYGQLGDGTLSSASAPMRVGSATSWTVLSAGAEHSFGLQTDGSMWGWGRNLEGQLGNGTLTSVSIPTKMP